MVIRRHAEALDRWFTQRLGYRLVVNADTARLSKSGHVPADRPLRTHTGRAFTGREHVALALVLAATAAGPDRISLRDLVLQVRSAAADAEITLDGGSAERRALVTALRWLVERGVVRELDRSVAGYEIDRDADALLEIRNDRLTMLHTPALVGAESAEELMERAGGDPPGGQRCGAGWRRTRCCTPRTSPPRSGPSCVGAWARRFATWTRCSGSASRHGPRGSRRSTSTAAQRRRLPAVGNHRTRRPAVARRARSTVIETARDPAALDRESAQLC